MSNYNMIGFSEDSDVTLLSFGFIIIICYLVVAEQSLSWVDEACRSTAYAQAVQSLYKELVIMGISGFILTVLLGTNVVPPSAWVFYMEIADVTLFFSALLHVFFSFSLILHNVSRNRSLKERLAKNVHELVDEISVSSAFKWNPFSNLREQLELRVLRIMFLKQFKLDRAFDFARYITLSEDHHIIEMLHVSPLQWSVVVALILVNFLRVKYKLDIHLFNAFVTRLCDEEKEELIKECETATYQCLLFTIMLYVFLVVLAVMAVTTRLYLLRLMRINGPQKSSEYCAYLLDDEVHEVQGDDPEDDGRMSLEHMKQTIQDMKKLHETREMRKKNGGSSKYNAADQRARSRTVEIPAMRSLKGLNRSKTAPEPSEDGATELAENANANANGEAPSQRRSSVFEDMLGVVSRRRSSVRQSIITQQHIVLITYSGIQSGLFLFDAGWLYFSVRDICNLLLCLYYAFYLATIIAVSTKTIDSLQWNLLCAAALLAATILQAYVIQASSTINAVSTFSSDVVGRVIEEQEEDKEIESMIRDKILRKVKQVVGAKDGTNIPRLKKAVGQLFAEIQNLDGISDNLVSKEELKVLLQRLNIFFSKSKFDRAFEIIDVDMSGTITLSEFVDFIFPDAAREARIQSRIMKLQAKGLIADTRRRTNDGSISDARGKYGNTKKFIKRLLNVSYFHKSASQKKYSAASETEYIGEAEEVIEFREKQKNIQARNQVNRSKLKKHILKKAAVRDSKNSSGHTDNLYNTLTASVLVLSKYRNQPLPSSEKATSVKLDGNNNANCDVAVESTVEITHEPESAVKPFTAPIEDAQQEGTESPARQSKSRSEGVSDHYEPPSVVSEFKEMSPKSAQVAVEPAMQKTKWMDHGSGTFRGSLESIRL